ncbi:MAG: class I SAM-dependent methyltransferase, partial [Thermomicrobiales bacterium]
MNASNREREWLEKAGRSWSERAESWDAMSTANGQTPERRAELARWAESLRLTRNSRLLDAGCGTGQFSIAFAQMGVAVSALDLSPEMISRARANARTADVDIAFSAGSLAPLPYLDATFDAIFCRMVLHLVPAPFAVLREFRRALRGEGRVYVSVPGALSPIYASRWQRHVDASQGTVNDMLPWELESLLQELG